MKQNSESTFLIINPIEENLLVESREERGDSGDDSRILNYVNLSSKQLMASSKEFLTEINKIFDEIELSSKNFYLDEIEISTALTITGKFSIISFGSELSGEGGIKFLFKKKK